MVVAVSKRTSKFVTIKVSSTSRSLSIPLGKAPYNFKINQEWMCEHNDEYTDMFLDWREYLDPSDFGENIDETGGVEA